MADPKAEVPKNVSEAKKEEVRAPESSNPPPNRAPNPAGQMEALKAQAEKMAKVPDQVAQPAPQAQPDKQVAPPAQPAPQVAQQAQPAQQKPPVIPTKPAVSEAQAPKPSSFIPTKRSEPVRDLRSLTMMIYGAPKIGKSTFANEMPDALFLPTEPGHKHLEIYQAPADGSGIRDWPHFIEVVTEVAQMNHPFKTLVIDTVDNLQKMCAEFVCKQRGVEYAGDMKMGKGWDLISNLFMRTLRRIAQLPMGLVLISHAVEKEIELPTGETQTRIVPAMTGKALKDVQGFVDMILYFDVHTEVAADGTRREIRVIRTQPSARYSAGCRLELGPDKKPFDILPPVLPLSADIFVKAWLHGQKRLAEAKSAASSASQTPNAAK